MIYPTKHINRLKGNKLIFNDFEVSDETRSYLKLFVADYLNNFDFYCGNLRISWINSWLSKSTTGMKMSPSWIKSENMRKEIEAGCWYWELKLSFNIINPFFVIGTDDDIIQNHDLIYMRKQIDITFLDSYFQQFVRDIKLSKLID